MTLHIFFALVKNVEIILQERERLAGTKQIRMPSSISFCCMHAAEESIPV